MIIREDKELNGMKRVSHAVGYTLKKMQEYACIGMSTKELDNYGKVLLDSFGANSAPKKIYNFPAYTCISVNHVIAHGIASDKLILQEGDLINVDVSAELDGFFSDNGTSFVIGEDIHNHSPLVEASRNILRLAINSVSGGVPISQIGRIIETEAKKVGFSVIENLAGHGVGYSLHEDPDCILNYYDISEKRRFRKDSAIAVETFISTSSKLALTKSDGWTLVGNKGGFVAQHEHTLLVTSGEPIILTYDNGIFS